MDLSCVIDEIIHDSIKTFISTDETILTNEFSELISMGELVDRLSIVNFKLYQLKDSVVESADSSFKSWAADEDVRLVEERARLKKCIDSKLIIMFQSILSGDKSAGINPEMKRYGKGGINE